MSVAVTNTCAPQVGQICGSGYKPKFDKELTLSLVLRAVSRSLIRALDASRNSVVRSVTLGRYSTNAWAHSLFSRFGTDSFDPFTRSFADCYTAILGS